MTDPLEIIIREATLKHTELTLRFVMSPKEQKSPNRNSKVLRNVNYKKLMCPHNSTICL